MAQLERANEGQTSDLDMREFVRQWGREPLEEPPCALCGSCSRRRLLEERFAGYVFGVVQCADCGFAYTCPRLPAKLREQLHTPELRNALVEAGILAPRHRIPAGRTAIFDYASQDVHLERYRAGLALLRARVQGGRLLDVGCAGGRFVELAAHAGFEAMGCDVDRAAVAYGRDLGLDLRAGEVTDVDVSPASLDVATLWNVLEHVSDPKATLAAVVSLLRPGGVVLVECPNFVLYQWRARLGMAPPPSQYRLSAYEHLNHFTARTLADVLRRAGCDDVGFSTATSTGAPGLKGQLRRAVTRLLFRLSSGRVNWHFPLLTLARRTQV